MCFYDFCQNVYLESIKKRTATNGHSRRLGQLRRFCLQPEHKLSNTHVLVEFVNDSLGNGRVEVVPRIIGMSIPRESAGDEYFIFMLAHFKPFSATVPLFPEAAVPQVEFESFQFAGKHKQIIQNWNDMYECEDERDAERMRKKAQAMQESQELTKSINQSSSRDEIEIDISTDSDGTQYDKRDFRLQQDMIPYKTGKWLQPTAQHALAPNVIQPIEVNDQSIKQWKLDMKKQEEMIISSRKNAQNVLQQSMGDHLPATESLVDRNVEHMEIDSAPMNGCTETEILEPSLPQSINEIVSKIKHDKGLNYKQACAYQIMTEHFIRHEMSPDAQDDHHEQLIMLMTGPGGTGKTYVVNAFEEVMKALGYSHMITYLAPTGTAANNISGSTIHKSLGIKIKSKHRGNGNRDAGEDREDYSVVVNVNSKKAL